MSDVRQLKVWGTPFTVTYRYYGHSQIGDVHSKGVLIHHNIDLREWLGSKQELRTLARRVENAKLLRRMRKEGRGFVPRKMPGMGARTAPGSRVQIGYVVTAEELPPVVYQEVNGCLRPLAV